MIGALRWLSPKRLIILAALLAAVAVALVLLWYFALRSDPPPPASLEAAVASVREQQQAAQEEAGAAQQTDAQQAQASVGDLDSGGAPDDAPSQAAQPGSDYVDYQQQEAPAETPSQQQAEQAAGGEDDAADDDATDGAQQDDAEQTVSVAAPPPALADLAGDWTLSERGESFVGYRIDEELANIGAATAVGRTGDITASLSFDGAAVTSVEIAADLRTLRSDQSFRDGALRTRGLESDTYPFATFRLTEPIPIARLPVGEDSLALTVAGTLELHGITNPVAIALQGQYVDGLVVVSGSTEIVLTDYEIEAPTGFRVLSIAESGLMEFQIVFEPAP